MKISSEYDEFQIDSLRHVALHGDDSLNSGFSIGNVGGFTIYAPTQEVPKPQIFHGVNRQRRRAAQAQARRAG